MNGKVAGGSYQRKLVVELLMLGVLSPQFMNYSD